MPQDQICHQTTENENLEMMRKTRREREKTCMPSRAKMKMKRTRRTSRATMEAIESTRDLTKPPMAFQYLGRDK